MLAYLLACCVMEPLTVLYKGQTITIDRVLPEQPNALVLCLCSSCANGPLCGKTADELGPNSSAGIVRRQVRNHIHRYNASAIAVVYGTHALPKQSLPENLYKVGKEIYRERGLQEPQVTPAHLDTAITGQLQAPAAIAAGPTEPLDQQRAEPLQGADDAPPPTAPPPSAKIPPASEADGAKPMRRFKGGKERVTKKLRDALVAFGDAVVGLKGRV